MTIRLRYLLMFLVIFALTACNLSTDAPVTQEALNQPTQTATTNRLATRTPASTSGIPTLRPVATQAGVLPRTQVVVIPPTQGGQAQGGSSQGGTISIVIIAPVPGSVLAGSVQVLGAALHPQFLQYQLEFGPDPNPSNLWYPASTAVQQPVFNGLLGIWNTTTTPDGNYQLRLRVYLRDGTTLSTVANNLRIQNAAPTPVPSNTPQIARPIAAFSPSPNAGQVPLTVQFANQSSGQINSYQWNFGDGTTSTEANPSHVYGAPGLYTVTLTVNGPGGSANVSSQINAQSPNPPVASFSANPTTGSAPLTVQFTDQTQGAVNVYQWDFSDGGISNDRNPSYTFNAPGLYNVFLLVNGPGGASSFTLPINVTSGQPPAETLTARFSASTAVGDAPLTVQFVNESQGQIDTYTWDFQTDGQPDAAITDPSFTFNTPGQYNVTLTVTNATGSASYSLPISVLGGAAVVDNSGQAPTAESSGEGGIQAGGTISEGGETGDPGGGELVSRTPILPDISGLAGSLRSVYDLGALSNNGNIPNQPRSLALAGDESVLGMAGLLRPFAAPGGYTLDETVSNLQAIIDWYSSTPSATGANSFNRESLGVWSGWRAENLLDPNRSNPDLCILDDGTRLSPLECELRISQASVLLVSVGYYDAQQQTDPATFKSAVDQIVVTALGNGVIPVLFTMRPGQDGAQTQALNNAIIEVANQYNVPLLNAWSLLSIMPNRGLSDDGATVSVSPNGPGDLTPSARESYGMNALNYHILVILNDLRNAVFPDAP